MGEPALLYDISHDLRLLIVLPFALAVGVVVAEVSRAREPMVVTIVVGGVAGAVLFKLSWLLW